jgi:hypothetical protein
MTTTLKRNLMIAVAGVIVIIALLLVGAHFATQALKQKVELALGSTGEVREMVVGLGTIELRGVRIRAPQGWPAADTLRAERVVVVPDLRGLLSAKIRVQRITIESAYLSILRSRDGKVHLLPSLLEGPGSKAAENRGNAEPATTPVTIGKIELRDSSIAFYDASIRQPAHLLQLEQIHADVGNLLVPGVSGRIALAIAASVKGRQRDGKLNIDGWLELADKNSQLATRLRGVDLVSFQPYLLKSAETGVKKGTLDLDLDASVQKNIMHAPGSITLTGLELEPGGGPFETFMGLPRSLIVATLKDKQDRIKVQFALDGDLADPAFSLNGSFLKQVGSTIAQSLGISIEGLARGVGNAPSGVTDALKNLFKR